MNDTYHRIKALVLLLVEKGVITKEEFDYILARVKKEEINGSKEEKYRLP